MGIGIVASGKSLPEFVVKNDDMAKLVDTDNDWIVERTGIQERHIAVNETGLDMAVAAGRKALGWDAGGSRAVGAKAENIPADSIDLVVVATVTPDTMVPAMSALIKKELGLKNAVCFDINMACSGFLYALWVTEAMLKATENRQTLKRALVFGVERLTRVTDWTQRSTCVLFGDGAGCVLLEENPLEKGMLSSYVKNYDDPKYTLFIGMDYQKIPFDSWEEILAGTYEQKDDVLLNSERTMKIGMKGTQVFRFAVNAVEEVMSEALRLAGLEASDIAYYVPHQANLRIISAAAQKFKQPIEKFQVNITHTGNVSSASVPMALYDALEEGKMKKGDKIMLVGFGGGLSAGAVIFEM